MRRGSALTQRLIDVGRRLEFSRLVAYVLATNRPMRALLDSSVVRWSTVGEHDLGPAVVCLEARL